MSSRVAFRSTRPFLSLLIVCSLAFVVLATAPAARGQVAITGKITGIITDSSGAAVPNASVTVKSTALFAPKSTQTESDGSYLFDLLPLGTYELTVTAASFRTSTQTGIVLTAGFTATVNAKLQLGEVSQVVKVESEPVVDLQNNQTTTTFDDNLLQEIPA